MCWVITSSFCLRSIVSPWYCTADEFCRKYSAWVWQTSPSSWSSSCRWQSGPICTNKSYLKVQMVHMADRSFLQLNLVFGVCSQITNRRWPPLFTKVPGKRRWQHRHRLFRPSRVSQQHNTKDSQTPQHKDFIKHNHWHQLFKHRYTNNLIIRSGRKMSASS